MRRLAPVAALACAASLSAATQPGLDVRVPFAPQVVPRSDGRFIDYELHLANYGRRAIRLQSVELLDADTGGRLALYEGAALVAAVGGQWVPRDAGDRLDVAGGGRAVMFVDQPVAGAMPRRLTHRIRYMADAGGVVTVTAPAVLVATATSIALAPPLRGGPWAAIYAPEMEFGHRRYVYAVDGVARVPGRYAIDFFGADRSGATPARYEVEPGYGAEVLAVADGTVVATRDDMPDPAGPADRPSPSVDDGAGNFVTLDLGGGRYAYYEHLRRGLRVRRGDRVRKGAVIASLGATGHVGGPHLHFHVGNGPDALRAEGVPFVLTGYDVLGGYGAIGDFDARRPWTRRVGGASARTMPAPGAVVRFAAPRS